MMEQEKKCRICGKEIRQYDEVKGISVDATRFFSKPVGRQAIDLKLYECKKCRHIQTEVLLEDSYYEDYSIVYNPNNDNMESGYPVRLLNEYKRCFQALYAMGSKHETLLDIGCAGGDILKLLEQMYQRCMGVEPSGHLQKKAIQKGCQVVHGYFDHTLVFPYKFDCITCLAVLEHIENLNEFMRALYDNLAEDGVALITVPNGQKIVAIQSYSDLFPEHINYFTTKSLMELIDMNGFEVIRLEEGFGENFYLIAYIRKKKVMKKFSQKKEYNQKYLRKLLQGYKNVAIWGIGVRARNLINLVYEITPDIKYLFDANHLLEGKYISGVNQCICQPSPDKVAECDLIFIMSLEYYDEILRELREKYYYKGTILYIKDGEYCILTD